MPPALAGAHFTIYAKKDCVYCDKAEALLTEFGYAYKKVWPSVALFHVVH